MNPLWPIRVVAAMVLCLSMAAPAHEKDQPALAAAPDRNLSPSAVVDAFAAALAKGDETAASALLATDVLIYESGGQEASRAEYASHHMKSDMAFLAGSKHEVLSRVQGGGDQQAWVATRSRITGRHKDKAFDLLSTESMMLQRTPEGWRIVHIHWSSQPAPKG